MRLIDADALRENMKFVCMGVMAGTEPYAAPLTEIDNAPTIEPEQRWIPCSERLPDEKEDTYWICTDSGYQCECRWTNDRWGFGGSDTWGWKPIDIPQYTKVVAWMPLPDPWKGAEHETD